ncbi:MAG: hypothetical protein OEL83_01430 [Desulforhopalus sp.]|nr:hypothetical protein [Desulforhopalus sp.]
MIAEKSMFFLRLARNMRPFAPMDREKMFMIGPMRVPASGS